MAKSKTSYTVCLELSGETRFGCILLFLEADKRHSALVRVYETQSFQVDEKN